MVWYHYLILVALLVCLTALSYHFIRLVRLGAPKEHSRPKGNTIPAIAYSFTGAMNPAKKESAYLHLPTYAAGLLYHLGTFTSVCLLPVFVLSIPLSDVLRSALIGLLTVASASGLAILMKRITVRRLRALSSPDDFISNILVTAFQLSTLAVLMTQALFSYYFVCVSALLLYMPLGKLKHALYFFAARYHLGVFYGWRGVWPLRKS